MAEIIWTSSAIDDVDGIAEYIAVTNLPAAKKLVRKVFDKVDRLANFPNSGKHPSELKELTYREVVVSPCRIFYKIENGKVFILHVMRQERDLRKYLLLS